MAPLTCLPESKALLLRKGVDTDQAWVHNFVLAAFRWFSKNQQKLRAGFKAARIEVLLLTKPYA
uniref:Uncharacterized protein n=1 Tax=mine drainage metagenome TaxID=410659 RepID=E6PKC1_9ZZZZ